MFVVARRAVDVRRAPSVLEGPGASRQRVEADCHPHSDPHRCSDSVGTTRTLLYYQYSAAVRVAVRVRVGTLFVFRVFVY